MIDPRKFWTPALLAYGILPWQMQDFTPAELRKLIDALTD